MDKLGLLELAFDHKKWREVSPHLYVPDQFSGDYCEGTLIEHFETVRREYGKWIYGIPMHADPEQVKSVSDTFEGMIMGALLNVIRHYRLEGFSGVVQEYQEAAMETLDHLENREVRKRALIKLL